MQCITAQCLFLLLQPSILSMAVLKTKLNEASVEVFINGIVDNQKREDSRIILNMMQKSTGAEPKMWGDSIVGFDTYHYVYASGREGDWMLTGFSPRKQSLTLYIMNGFDHLGPMLKRLGKYKTSKGCLYIKRLSDVDLAVLQEIVDTTVKYMKEKYH